MSDEPIYVEIRLRAPLDDLWRATQTPELHERWDLRFTDIDYLPRPDESKPQRFRYATRIGFGLEVRGEGETVGERHTAGGLRTSALKFWSDDPKSLICDGAGYWKYVPTENGIRFLTAYDYRTRFGPLGRLVDRFIFRPLMGWATAWSFDRLRLWLERGIPPEVALREALVHATARLGLAGIWLYHGLVPKLLFPDSGELAILRGSGLLSGHESSALLAVALAELLFGLLMLAHWRARWHFLANLLVLPLLALGALASQPAVFVAPFNPATLTVAMMGLALAGYLCGRDLPTAARCLRRPPRGEV